MSLPVLTLFIFILLIVLFQFLINAGQEMVKRMSALAEAEAEAINGRSGGWRRQQTDVGVSLLTCPYPFILFS